MRNNWKSGHNHSRHTQPREPGLPNENEDDDPTLARFDDNLDGFVEDIVRPYKALASLVTSGDGRPDRKHDTTEQ
jgi:hypothetical protein